MVDILAINRDGDGYESDTPLAAVLRPKRVVSMCAALPPEHPRNEEFINACRQAPHG